MTSKQWLAAVKRKTALAAAVFVIFAVLPANTSAATNMTSADSGTKPLLTAEDKVLELNFDNSDLTDSGTGRSTISKIEGKVSFTNGVSGPAANFNDAALSLDKRPSPQADGLSLSFWYQPAMAMNGREIFMWADNGNDGGWSVSSESETKPLVLSVGSQNSGSVQPIEFDMLAKRSEVFRKDIWTHVMLTWDGATNMASFYINGVKQPSRANGNSNANGSMKLAALPSYMGWDGVRNSGGRLNGSFDEVKLWRAAGNTADVEREELVGNRKFKGENMATDGLNSITLPSQTTGNLSLPSTCGNGTTVVWTTSDSKVISDTGTVNRPGKGEHDSVVTLQAEGSYGSKTMTRTFTITVPAKKGTANPQYLSESDMSKVRVTDRYLDNAAAKEIQYLNSFDVDRLLVEFRVQSGLPTKGLKNYGGWERGYDGNTNEGGEKNPSRFTGHFVGHYLSAVSQAQHATFATVEQKQQLENRLSALVSGIRQAQTAYGKSHEANNGFLPAFKVDALPNGKDGLMVPFYNLHKVEQGLTDAYKYSADDQTRQSAKEAAVDFAKFVVNWKHSHPDVNMLSTEYGGMNDALYQVAAIADSQDKQTVLSAAHMFDETDLFKELADNKDILDGNHANTLIPKLTGAMRRYVLYTSDRNLYDGLSPAEQGKLDSLYLNAARNCWDIITTRHSYANGGNSQSEHFHAPNQMWKDATQNGDPEAGGGYADNSTVETCNEHNMLKLTRLLFQVTKQSKYCEYYENTFINSILSSQNPETGMTTYFQPMKAGYPKVFGTEYGEFWCCQGTGIENFSKLNDSLYFTDDNDIYVNMFWSSTFTDDRHGLRIEQEAKVPKTDTVTFTVSSTQTKEHTGQGSANLKLRVPQWSGKAGLVVDSKTMINPVKDDNGWLTVPIHNGTKIQYTLPAKLQVRTSADNPNWVAFSYGPIVLAGSLRPTNPQANYGYGGILVRTAAFDADSNALAQIFPSDDAQGNTVSTAHWLEHYQDNLVRTDDPNDDKDIAFKFLNVQGGAADIALQPYYTLYQSTYAMYWDLTEVDSEAYQSQILRDKNEERDLAFNTDSLESFDNQEQDEIGSHNLNRKDSQAGTYHGHTYRHAKLDGWITYDFKVDTKSAHNYLGLRFTSADAGRTFDVMVDPTPLSDTRAQVQGELSDKAKLLTSVKITRHTEDFYWQTQEIPASLVNQIKNGKIRIKFIKNEKTKDGTGAEYKIGGIYGIRTSTAQRYAAHAKLKDLAFDTGSMDSTFKPSTTKYTLTVEPGTSCVKARFYPADPGAYVRVDDVVIKDGAIHPRSITLDGDVTEMNVSSVAQDHVTTVYYTVVIVKRGSRIPAQSDPVLNYSFNVDTDVRDGGTIRNTGSAKERLNGKVVNPGATLVDDGSGGKALKLTGGVAGSQSPYVSIPSGAIISSQKDATIRIRAKWDGARNCLYPFNMGRDEQNYLSFIVSCSSTTRMESKVANVAVATLAGQTPDKNTEVDATVVLRGGRSISYYLNGRLIKSVATTLNASQVIGTGNISGYLGKSFYQNDPFFGGEIEDFRIWDRALSTGELFPSDVHASSDATLSRLEVSDHLIDLDEAQSREGATLELENPTAVTDHDVSALVSSPYAHAKIYVSGKVVTIKVEAENGTVKTYTVHLSAITIPVTSVDISGEDVRDGMLTIKVGRASTLRAQVLPKNATDQTVRWRSGDDGIASVENGVVHANATGLTDITATAGQVTSVVKVMVVPDEDPVNPASDDEFEHLRQAIESAQNDGLCAQDYTADSWSRFSVALKEAKEVYADKQSTSQQVGKAIDALESSRAGLVRIKPDDRSNTSPANKDDAHDDIANTGGPIVEILSATMSLALIGLLLAVVLKVRRR